MMRLVNVPYPRIPQLEFQNTYAIQSRGSHFRSVLSVFISGETLLFRSRRSRAMSAIIL